MNAVLDSVLGSEATGRFLAVLLVLFYLSWMLACWIGLSAWVLRSVRPQDQSLYDRPDPSETRTKESNLCASIRVVNPDAQ